MIEGLEVSNRVELCLFVWLNPEVLLGHAVRAGWRDRGGNW
jgi:hypothetical protein